MGVLFTGGMIALAPRDARKLYKSIIQDAVAEINKKLQLMAENGFSEADMSLFLLSMSILGNDTANRVIFNDFFRGLGFMQISVRADEMHRSWTLRPPLHALDPLSHRIECYHNGVYVTHAPPRACIAWRLAPARSMLVFTGRRNPVHLDERICGTCLAEHGLRSCDGCYLIRYCNAACQRQDWQQHKHLCLWAKACIFGDAAL